MKKTIASISVLLFLGLGNAVFSQVSDSVSTARTPLTEMTKRAFRQEIWNPNNTKKFQYNGSETILLDFGATWCKPCKRTQPILEELQTEYNGKIKFYTIDIDKEANSTPDYPTVFDFDRIPVIMVIKPGMKKKPIAYKIGGLDKEQIRSLIVQLTSEKEK